MKKIKILITLMLCMALITTIKFPSYANVETDTPVEISPRYTHILSTMTSLTNNGKAYSKGSVNGISQSSSLKVFLYLEKYSNGTWSVISSDYSTKTGSNLILTMTTSVSSGTYRVKGSYYANGENTIKYSSTVTF